MRRLYHGSRLRFVAALACIVTVLVVVPLLFVRAALAQPAAPHEAGHEPARPDSSAGAATSASAPLLPSASVAGASSASPTLPHASAQASASASASGSASAVRAASTEIRVRDKLVFVVRAARGGRTAAERARAANGALETLLAHPDDLGDVRFEETQGTAVVYIGKNPILTLGSEDVELSGEATLAVLAAQVTSRLEGAVTSERKRSQIATTVFSISLLVFSALVAFWLLGRASEVAGRLRTWMTDNPERVAGLRLGKIEVVSAGAARGMTSIGVTLGFRFIQIAVAYAWLVFGLSLFESTRGYTEKLTGMVVGPLYALAARIGSALPVAIVAAIAVIAVTVLVRFIGLFFDSVVRGDTRIAWLSRDLARPTSALVRFGIVVIALVLASPLITGESDGAFSRVGLIALVAVALAATPLLASAVVGVMVVYGRRIKKGELVEFGGRAGRVTDVTLFEVRMEDAAACDLSVPHLLGLVHPTRVHRHPPLASVEVVVDPTAPQADVEKALTDAARTISSRGRVDLVYLDDAGALWRVTSATHRGEITLGRVVQEALTKLGVGLGRGRRNGPASVRASADGVDPP